MEDVLSEEVSPEELKVINHNFMTLHQKSHKNNW